MPIKLRFRFIDRELLPHLAHGIRELAAFINVEPSHLTLVPSATVGMNAAISSLPLSGDDSILFFSTVYGSVRKMIYYRLELPLCLSNPVKMPREWSGIC